MYRIRLILKLKYMRGLSPGQGNVSDLSLGFGLDLDRMLMGSCEMGCIIWGRFLNTTYTIYILGTLTHI